jgi:hypothetical protein
LPLKEIFLKFPDKNCVWSEFSFLPAYPAKLQTTALPSLPVLYMLPGCPADFPTMLKALYEVSRHQQLPSG